MTSTQNEAYISEQEIMENIVKVQTIVYHRHTTPRIQAIAMNALMVAQDRCFPAQYRLRWLNHALLEYSKENKQCN